MSRRYDITDVFDRVDKERYDWLKNTLEPEQWKIVDDGFLISSYNLYFPDPAAETLYLLRWGND